MARVRCLRTHGTKSIPAVYEVTAEPSMPDIPGAMQVGVERNAIRRFWRGRALKHPEFHLRCVAAEYRKIGPVAATMRTQRQRLAWSEIAHGIRNYAALVPRRDAGGRL